MKSAAFWQQFTAHVLALLGSAAYLAIWPAAAYAGLILWSGDLGGPLNLVLIPLLSAGAGLFIGLFVYCPLSLLAQHFHFRKWLLATWLSTVALVLVAVPSWIYAALTKVENSSAGFITFVACLGLYAIGGFFIYLCSLAVWGWVLVGAWRLAGWIWERVRKPKVSLPVEGR
jgi:hypothetical protein